MILKFLRLPKNDLPLPKYETPGAAGMDLRACLPDGPIVIEPGATVAVQTGFKVELPADTEMQIRPRSGLATRASILVPNSPGTVDCDYRGELKVALLNNGIEPFKVEHGARIAQAIIAPVLRPTIVEVAAISKTERGSGGFGSTGLD